MGSGLDYVGAIPTATLKAGGVSFVCRYLREVGSTEIRSLHVGGIDVILIHEYSGTTPRGGFNNGLADARLALSQANALGAPSSAVIYFAADFDATVAEQPAINAYLRGCASIVGIDRVGLYGGYWPVKRALDAGVLKWGWQTYAWSGGNFDKRCVLYQYSNAHTFAGHGVDYDKFFPVNGFYGQWSAQAQPVPVPVPPPPQGVSIVSIATNGQDYPNTELFAEEEPAGPGKVGDVYHIRNDPATPSHWWENSDGTARWLRIKSPNP